MHRLIIVKDAAHRLACLSLYRDLLRQCTRFHALAASSGRTDTDRPPSTLQSLVRYRFKKDKKLKKWQPIRHAIQFGRGALHLLQEAIAGSPEALEEMSSILSTSTTIARQNARVLEDVRREQTEHKLPAKFIKRKETQLRLANKSNYERQPETVPVLQRPVPFEQALKDKNGNRKVPNYFVVQNIPFLRYTRRQPLSLGRYFMQEMERLEKVRDQSTREEEMIQMAEMEDAWDTRLSQEHKVHQPDSNMWIKNPSHDWAHAHREVVRENQWRVKRIFQKHLDNGQKLWQVYLKEEDLAKKEAALRKEEKRKQQSEQRTQVA